MKAAKPRDMIIWDNSEREDANDGIDVLLKEGEQRITIKSMLPITFGHLQTSIFCRRGNNCIVIKIYPAGYSMEWPLSSEMINVDFENSVLNKSPYSSDDNKFNCFQHFMV